MFSSKARSLLSVRAMSASLIGLLLVSLSVQVSANDSADKAEALPLVHFDTQADEAAANNPVLARLLDKADQLQLALNDQWLRRLHFEPVRFGKPESLIDAANFFLSERGKTDARAELRATLASFFSSVKLPPLGLTAGCRFVERYHWLNSHLDLDAAGLGQQQCPAYERFMQATNPEALTVVFASSHPGGPSSMFGHTLLRIDQKDQPESMKMLAWSVNYAADTGGDANPAAYAVRGLSGGFPGRFSVLPYYLKMREYGQMEDRAIWEYRLDLNQEQVNAVVRHVFEVAPAWSKYYFFSENCSYLLLTLVDVALPGPRISSRMQRWVIPADSVKVLEDEGLIQSVNRDPGYNEVIRARRKTLTKAERRLAVNMAGDQAEQYAAELSELSNERQAAVLDLAFDYRRYRRIRDTDHLDAKLTKTERKLLSRRAALGGRSKEPDVTMTARPDKGHRSQRLEVGVGELESLKYLSLGWRAAYHDVLDPQAGYRRNSRLEVMDVQARVYRGAGNGRDTKIELDHLDILDVLAIEPRDEFFHHLSWNLKAGLESVRVGRNIRTISSFSGGAGFSLSLTDNDSWVGYAMFDGGLDYANFMRADYRLGVGPRLGLISQLGNTSRLHIESRYLWSVAGDNNDDWRINVGFSEQLNQRYSVKLELERNSRFDRVDDQFRLSLQYYY